MNVLARGFKEAIGLALTSTKDTAFVSDLSGKVYAVDLKRGEKIVLVDIGSQQGEVTGMVLV